MTHAETDDKLICKYLIFILSNLNVILFLYKAVTEKKKWILNIKMLRILIHLSWFVIVNMNN